MAGNTSECSAGIACGDLPDPFLEHLREAVGLPGVRLSLLSISLSAKSLIVDVARVRPEFVLVPEPWLRQESLDLLDHLASAHRSGLAIVVGDDLGDLTLAHALRRGLRGIVSPGCEAAQLRRVFETVRQGELWVSRKKVIKALHALTPSEPDASIETWRNLPALTEREHSILQETLDGKSNKQIAHALQLSEHTVKIHLQHIYQKLGVHRRLDLLKAKA